MRAIVAGAEAGTLYSRSTSSTPSLIAWSRRETPATVRRSRSARLKNSVVSVAIGYSPGAVIASRRSSRRTSKW